MYACQPPPATPVVQPALTDILTYKRHSSSSLPATVPLPSISSPPSGTSDVGPARNEKKMAGSFFEQRKSPTKVRTSVGLGVDLVNQLGHGGLPIGHGGGGLVGGWWNAGRYAR